MLNTEATKEILDKEKYDSIIIAVGADPLVPNLKGVNKPHVHWAPETEVFIVGDAIEVGTIAEAVNSAFNAAVHI